MLPPIRFAVKLTVFSILLIACFFAIDCFAFQMPSSIPLYLSAFILFSIVSFLIYRLLFASSKERPTAFVNRFMGSLMIKLLLFVLATIVSGFLLPKPEVKSFIVFLIITYISYTIFMTYHLMAKNNGRGEKT